MLHIDSSRIRSLLRQGHFGIEKESLRVTGSGRMSHSPHLFDADDSHIVRDLLQFSGSLYGQYPPLCRGPDHTLSVGALLSHPAETAGRQ